MTNSTIDLKDAFLHLIYDYRYLATAGYAWQTVGPSGSQEDQAKANELVPEIGSLVQDSLLAHARSLIDFYTKTNGRDTDILLANFNSSGYTLSLSRALQTQIESYKHSIEVQALHLTSWRDVNYRTANATTTAGLTRGRPDWNIENQKLIQALLDSLEEISKITGAWQKPFTELYSAAQNRLADGKFDWPNHLTEKQDVTNYLTGLGL